MIKNYILAMVFTCLFALSGFAQQLQVSGTVTDDQSTPLPGVSVQVSGTDKGTITDFEGNYSIEVTQGVNLVFSYVGFETQTLNATSAILNVIMTSGVALDQVVLIGTRNPSRTAVNSAVPVDVLSVSEIAESSPQITVTEILNYAAPSFSSNPQTISDGTDHIAPASLRGLGPDQVLVLLNGKRRHKTALVNTNGTFGRGSVGTDLSAIPTNAIERIEILRDGAAAQYGSDAIAGVINIVLKKNTNELAIDVTTGANFTSENYDDGVDGEKINVGANYGLPIGDKGGFVNFTGNFNFRGATNRMRSFGAQIFTGYSSIERVASNNGFDLLSLQTDVNAIQNFAQSAGLPADVLANVNGANSIEELQGILNYDNTNTELGFRNLDRSDFNMRVGNSELRGGQFFGNLEIPLGGEGDFKLYSFGGIGFKNGNAAGFYRLPYQARNVTSVYLNGFLPEINSNIKDKAVAVGIRGKVGEWNVDISNNTGINEFTYRISNTLNASLLNSTPLEADAGGYRYQENTTNLDVSRFYEDIMSGFNIAYGAEYRVENYDIIAGQEVSYAQYNTNGNVHDPSDPESVVPTDFFGETRPGGIQVFPGFAPKNVVDAYRTSVAGYLDLEADFTETFRLTGALRYENFSDFGGTLNFKSSFLWKLNSILNLRGSVQSGFRAPSLHQINYNSTSTLFVDGVPQEVGIFSNNSRVARLLNIAELKEETSLGYTIGFTAKVPDANMSFTADGYLIDIDDRVVLTGQFGPNNNAELERLFTQANATQAAFFVNSINTRTMGIDFVADHSANLGSATRLKNTLSFTVSKTNIENINIPGPVVDANLSDTYFDRTSEIYLESAVPRTKGSLTNTLFVGDKWNFFLRNTYFGEVEEATNNVEPDINRIYAGKVVTDLSASYKFSESLRLTVGANNLLDIYPDMADPEFQSDGRFLYSRRSTQFGIDGRYLFARLNIVLK
ncbi:TonB-dependent receptor [Flavimarina sp. Hel_I_48]|uniref:TonB-dependent receptor n=1 Tax=Flavimarina sp. Hel_I_48 TaxID=1392488 RepID=UPI0004DF31C2|nr:TonB-dependent receptor [Flavimarina sp. Hel_I_48]